MFAGIVVAIALSTLYPDDIPALGSLTDGIFGFCGKCVDFVVCTVESARIDGLFEVAAGGLGCS